MQPNPRKRICFQDILRHKWLNKPMPNKIEVKTNMEKFKEGEKWNWVYVKKVSNAELLVKVMKKRRFI